MECGKASCIQERRALKRELLSWSRKIPVLLGLEAIATEVCGRKQHKKVLQVLEPFRESTKTDLVDFAPNEECAFCDLDNGAPKGEDCTNHTASSTYPLGDVVPSNSSASNYMQSLLSAYVSACSQSALPSDRISHSNCQSSPVDLTSQAAHSNGPKRKESKRGYTEEELRTALKEIKAGRLGTRRAAVLYGIPRSTLRNKIFKMSLQEQSQKADVSNNNAAKSSPKGQRDLTITDLLATPTFAQKEEKKKLSDLDNDTAGWPSRLDMLRHKHRLDSPVQHPFLPQPIDDQNLALWSAFCTAQLLQLSHLSQISAAAECPTVSSILPQLSRQLVNEKFLDVRKTDNADSQDPESQVQLKIPNYKARLLNETKNKNHSPNGHLKDVIAKTLNDKLKNRSFDKSLETIPPNLSQDSVVSPNSSDASTSCNSMPPPNKKAKRASKKEENTVPSDKKTRPKRGQYRKYNSQLLLEAVAAVQRGEMSVHRAGSYFGVPHSTLEYKVKERHLLRKKTKEAAKNANATKSNGDQQAASPSASTTSLSTNPESETADPNSPPTALNTPASELLKKLQQKVQSKTSIDAVEETE